MKFTVYYRENCFRTCLNDVMSLTCHPEFNPEPVEGSICSHLKEKPANYNASSLVTLSEVEGKSHLRLTVGCYQFRLSAVMLNLFQHLLSHHSKACHPTTILNLQS